MGIRASTREEDTESVDYTWVLGFKEKVKKREKKRREINKRGKEKEKPHKCPFFNKLIPLQNPPSNPSSSTIPITENRLQSIFSKVIGSFGFISSQFVDQRKSCVNVCWWQQFCSVAEIKGARVVGIEDGGLSLFKVQSCCVACKLRFCASGYSGVWYTHGKL